MFGYAGNEELLNLNVSDLYQNPEDRKRFNEKILKHSFVKDEEILLKKKSGVLIWASVTAVAVSNDKGQVKYYDGVIEDITIKKQFEKALKDSENKYRTIFENTGTAILIAEDNLIISLVNSEFEKVTGYTKEEVEGKKAWTEFILKDDAIRMKEFNRLRRMNSSGVPVRYEFRYINKKGEVRDAMINVAIIPGTKKTISSILDITEHKRMEEEIKKRKKYLESVVRHAPDAIVTLDARHHIIEWNPGAEQIFGYTSEEVLGRNLDDIITIPKVKKEAEGLTKLVLSGERVPPMDTVRYRKDGTPVNVIVAGSPIRIGGELHGVVAIYTDITDYKKAEEEKTKIKAQLIQAQKMEAVGILAGGIAHDFNNLLTAIQGCAEMIMLNIDETDPSYQDLMEIRASTARAADLTRQLLLFSRKHFMELKSLNLNDTIESLMKMLHRLIGEDVVIKTQLEQELWAVRADRGTMEQVIMNIAVNARDALPNGGQLFIKTENIPLENPSIYGLQEGRSGKYVRLSITDNGVGMDKETLRHCFEPFFSTKEFGKGTGLGLSVVYGIVKQHKGWINVYSEPGQGTEFKIYLPTATVEPEGETVNSYPLEQYQGTGERLLVVEDDHNLREFTMRALHNNGYIVFGVESAKESLEVFEREKGNFDLVFSDVVLPDKTGVELVEELLTRKPGLKVLFSSGYSDHKSQWPVIQKKGYRFLEKPYALADLLRVIHELAA
jgi:PAS domain S-box-containing protein